MNRAGDDEAGAVKDWLDRAGLTFEFGTDGTTELTRAQVKRWRQCANDEAVDGG